MTAWEWVRATCEGPCACRPRNDGDRAATCWRCTRLYVEGYFREKAIERIPRVMVLEEWLTACAESDEGPDYVHALADAALLEFINEESVHQAYAAVTKWYG